MSEKKYTEEEARALMRQVYTDTIFMRECIKVFVQTQTGNDYPWIFVLSVGENFVLVNHKSGEDPNVKALVDHIKSFEQFKDYHNIADGADGHGRGQPTQSE